MLMVSPPRPEVVGPLPNGRTPWLINGGDPNYLLSGVILQIWDIWDLASRYDMKVAAK